MLSEVSVTLSPCTYSMHDIREHSIPMPQHQELTHTSSSSQYRSRLCSAKISMGQLKKFKGNRKLYWIRWLVILSAIGCGQFRSCTRALGNSGSTSNRLKVSLTDASNSKLIAVDLAILTHRLGLGVLKSPNLGSTTLVFLVVTAITELSCSRTRRTVLENHFKARYHKNRSSFKIRLLVTTK
jgi:hypothetical protein